MGNQGDDKHVEQAVDDLYCMRALALELKSPLINIARQSELADVRDFAEIQHTAEQALTLIDSYLLSAQADHGQLSLNLEPVSLGSVLYDASVQLSRVAKKQALDLVIDDRAHDPVMTNRGALVAVLAAFGQILMSSAGIRRSELVLRSYRTSSGELGVGVFADVNLSENDLRQEIELQRASQMPIARVSNRAHASMVIAENLCSAMGGNMTVKKMGRLKGFGTLLPRSEQLSFV